MLSAGRLRHRVQLQIPVETQDSQSGAINVSWQTIATLWASIEPLSAREYIAAQAESSRVSTRILIRYRDINAKARFYHQAKDQYYNIEGDLADKDSGLEYLTIPCSEGLRYIAGTQAIPVNLILPAITGNMTVGQTINASTGSWANNPSDYDYQWYLNGIAIPGAVNPSLIVPNNLGSTLNVGIIASNSGGDGTEAISVGKIIL